MIQIQAWPIDRLIPYARNARTHSDAQIAQVAASIKEFGFVNPILVGPDNVIVAGHARLLAARKLGLAEVPVIVLDHLTKAQRRALVLADNKLALNAGWNDELLRIELDAVKDEGFLDLTGFGLEELEALAVPNPASEGLTDEDAVPDTPAVPTSTLGDCWRLGAHRLVCGDSTDISAVQRMMGGEHADLVFTDPPYGVAVASRVGTRGVSSAEARSMGTAKIENDDLSIPALTEFLRVVFGHLLTVTRKGACWYVTAPHGPMGLAFSIALNEVGVWRHSLVWVKDSLVMGRMDYHYRHEPIFYGWTPGAPHHAVPTRDQDTVWQFPRPKRSLEHPTMKPVELVERAIDNSSKAGDLVADLFGGSGTTLIACERRSRRARLMELDPKYCDVIVKRWQEFTGKSAVHEESGQAFDDLAESRKAVAA